ncbi:MAG: Do family serine endopeptidase [Gallionella sp.]|nr:Do family serine endopeptidase [Gallionella sp.]
MSPESVACPAGGGFWPPILTGMMSVAGVRLMGRCGRLPGLEGRASDLRASACRPVRADRQNFTRGLSWLAALLALMLAACERPPVLPQTRAAAVTVALPNFTELVKKEGPAVVNISTTRKIRGGIPFFDIPEITQNDSFYEFFRRFAPGMQHEYSSQTLGSGFIISPDGYLLTNAHVVEESVEVTVRLTDKREFNAKIVGTDRRSDIALLKISATGLPVAAIGNSGELEVGEWVAAIGSPFGFSNSISQGIVSAKGRSLPGEDIVPFIQTDVSINPGNSGGPLFNMKGEVVGINSQIYSRSGGYMGLSFAIPIDLAMKVRDELQKHGTVRRGRLGVTIQNVTAEHAKSFGLDKAAGALVSSVEKGGPADRAGIDIGDIILKFDGHEIGDTDELLRQVAQAAPESEAKLTLWRQGATKEVTVRLGEADGVKHAEPGQIGLVLRELAREEQRALHTEGSLVVESVSGVARYSGIQPRDIVIAVNSQRVSTVGQLQAALLRAGHHGALLVQREGMMIYIPLKYE